MNRDLVIAAFAPLVWGSTYLVTTEWLPADRPLLAATLRALPIGLLITLHGRELPRGHWWWRSALLGLLNIGAFFALLFLAAYRLPGGVAATAGAIQPLVVASLAALLLDETLRARVGIAGVLGIGGVGLLVLGPDAALDTVGVAAALGGTLSMATGVVLTKRWKRPTSLLTATGWQLTAGGLVLLPLTLLVEGPPPGLTAVNVAGYAWLAVVGTGLAYVLWFRGIDRLPVSALTFLGLLSPLVATSLGWLVLGQRLSPVQLAGMSLIVTAVVLPQFGLRRSPATTAPRPHGRPVDEPRPADRGDRLPSCGAERVAAAAQARSKPAPTGRVDAACSPAGAPRWTAHGSRPPVGADRPSLDTTSGAQPRVVAGALRSP